MLFRQVVRDITLGKFNYDQCFDRFVEATTQKQDTASLLADVVNGFKELGLISKDHKKSIRVADVGCANATASLLFLEKISHASGYSYLGIDALKKYIKEANDKLSSHSLIHDYQVFEGDGLSGELFDTVFNQKKSDLVFVSHVAYYLQQDEVKYNRFIHDMQQLLSAEGVCFFMHGASHVYLDSITNQNNLPRTKTHELIEQYAEKLEYKSTSIDFVSKLNFPCLTDELWEMMEKTENYRLPMIQNNHAALSTLEILSIIVNRDLLALEKNGTLQTFIRAAKDIIADNGGFLYLHTHFQVMTSNECQVSLERITETLKNALQQYPDLMIDASTLKVLNQPKAKQVNAPAFY